ncbi:AraC family transcriptional regulator [Mahella australiensis]|uniref:Transcriptional regulator, AraC family n=1 Tax=Mahella australiensis (strain DSM 15567 / CIP 107919 / 50-1 BON) TaxID=697281 RepID=F4A2J5_MAHA5|nr:AraC family transcriptional regulator [Mahella australiensis]AEE97261.1 transcriptional regulator, AraC family [Mahella australiensis 50-1 BON]
MHFTIFNKDFRKVKGIFFNQLLIASIFLAIAPALVIFILSYSNYNSALENQAKSQNIFMVEQYNKNIEDSLSKLINETNRLLLNENINTFDLSMSKLYFNPSETNIFLSIYNSLMEEQRVLYETVDSIYLYYPKINLVISNYGYYEKNAFYDTDIIKTLDTDNTPKFDYYIINRKINYPENYSMTNRYLGNVLTVIRPMPFSINKAFLVLNIKEDVFLHINNTDKNMTDIFLITDEKGNEVFSSIKLKDKYDYDVRSSILKSIPNIWQSGFFINNDESDLTVFYSEPNKYGLRTVMLLPNNYIYTNIDSLKLLIIAIFAFTMACSLIVSYIISQKLYGPLGHLLSNIIIKKSNTANIIKNRNEFSLIEKEYTSITEQNLQFSQKLSANLPLLKELFFKNILDGKSIDIESINKRADFLEITNIKDATSFTVYVLLVENTINVLDTDNILQLHYLKEAINTVIKNELKYENIEVLYISADDDMVILVSWDEETDNKQFIPERIDLALKNQIAANIYIGVGITVNDITALKYSYSTAINSIHYVGINDTSNIAYADHCQYTVLKPDHIISKYKKQLLLDILNCDYDNSIATFNKMVNEILTQNILYECFQEAIIQLLNDILRFIETNGIPVISIDKNLYKEIMNIKTVKDVINWTINQLNEIIYYISNHKTDHHSVLAIDIVNYIHANYDKNINLETTADHFSLSRQCFSKIFSQEVGKSFNDYLNAVRLEVSIKYLKESDMSVKDISEKVGFGSSQYYIKLFKNKYGITPAQYRDKINYSYTVSVAKPYDKIAQSSSKDVT